MLRPAFLRIPFDARSQELINCRPLLVGRIATRTILNTRASVRPAPFLRNVSRVIRTRGAIRTFSDAVNDPQAVAYIITVPIGGLLAAVLVCKVLVWLGLMDDPMDPPCRMAERKAIEQQLRREGKEYTAWCKCHECKKSPPRKWMEKQWQKIEKLRGKSDSKGSDKE